MESVYDHLQEHWVLIIAIIVIIVLLIILGVFVDSKRKDPRLKQYVDKNDQQHTSKGINGGTPNTTYNPRKPSPPKKHDAPKDQLNTQKPNDDNSTVKPTHPHNIPTEQAKPTFFFLKANSRTVFTKWTQHLNDDVKFKAHLIAEGKAEIELIDVNRIRSMQGVEEVVFDSGNVQLKEANGVTTVEPGIIIKKSQGSIEYWEVTKKISVKYIQ